MARTSFASLSHADLAALVREYLMAGHLIDRAGMPYVLAAFDREMMGEVAIEEWSGASPIYTKRMQRAFGFEGDSVETIFKGMQLDIGAPPQFLDFRYSVDDHDHGEFWLDHCGALADVEPMGEEFVVTMCHDIEDPTFDATAAATNPKAQVRPIHRPPRRPAGRTPVCHWTVVIDDGHESLAPPPAVAAVVASRAAGLELSPIDPAEPGRHDYAGPLLADLRFDDWSHSALVRMAEEVCLQGHLLALSYRAAVDRRTASSEQTAELFLHQFTGVAGVVAQRLLRARDVGSGPAAVARLIEVHPALLPHQYVGCTVEGGAAGVEVRFDVDAPAVADGAWAALLHGGAMAPLDAIAAAVDPRFRFDIGASDTSDLVAELVIDDQPRPLAEPVSVAAISTGANFEFRDRGVPIEVRRR